MYSYKVHVLSYFLIVHTHGARRTCAGRVRASRDQLHNSDSLEPRVTAEKSRTSSPARPPAAGRGREWRAEWSWSSNASSRFHRRPRRPR